MALFELLVNAIRVRRNALPWTRARTGTSTEYVVPATPWRMIPARSATAASSAKTAGAMDRRTPTATWTRRRRFMSVFLLLAVIDTRTDPRGWQSSKTRSMSLPRIPAARERGKRPNPGTVCPFWATVAGSIGRSKASFQELQDFLLVLLEGVLPGEDPGLLPVAGIEHAEGQLASPGRIDGVDELPVVAPGRLAIVGKARLQIGQQLLDGRHLRAEVGRDAEDPQTPRAVLALQPREIRELVAAGGAPGRPEVCEGAAPLLLRDPTREPLCVHRARDPGSLGRDDAGQQE